MQLLLFFEGSDSLFHATRALYVDITSKRNLHSQYFVTKLLKDIRT